MAKKPKAPALQPLHDRVIISDPPMPPKKGERSIGGIIIPEAVKGSTLADVENPHYVAKILAVGAECKFAKAGQRAVIPRQHIFGVKVEEKTYSMVRELNIVAVL